MIGDQGDDVQTDRLSRQVKSTRERLKQLETELLERKTGQEERKAKATESSKLYTAYSTNIETRGPLHSQSLMCNAQELLLLKGLLEIRQKIEGPAGFPVYTNANLIKNLLDKITELQGRPSY